MKKLSEAFLEFIEPALEMFGNPTPKTLEFDAACTLGHVVWNAVTMEALNPGKDHVTAAKMHGGHVPELDALFDKMVTHKREHFGSDHRLIGVYDIVEKPDGSFSVWTQIVENRDVN